MFHSYIEHNFLFNSATITTILLFRHRHHHNSIVFLRRHTKFLLFISAKITLCETTVAVSIKVLSY